MERLRVVINFKNTPEDIALYNSLKRHSSMSGYIKDILKGLVNVEIKELNQTVSKNINNDYIVDDISDDIADILG